MKKLFRVDEIEIINFDENGKENGTWEGFSVVKIDDEANYCFDCRDKTNADRLCDFLNNECIINNNDAIDGYVIDNCVEWNQLIEELSDKEINLFYKKEAYQVASDKIIEETDFKELYGKNNQDIRKQHVKKELKNEYAEIKDLEFSIDFLKRRITFLKYLVRAKTATLGVEDE